jgi:hypothetical protein
MKRFQPAQHPLIQGLRGPGWSADLKTRSSGWRLGGGKVFARLEWPHPKHPRLEPHTCGTRRGVAKKNLKLGTLTALILTFEALQAIHRSTPPTNHIPNPP